VRAAAQRVIDTHDPEVLCTELVTAAFVDDVFAGKRQACVRSSLADPSTDGSTDRVVDVAVTGDTASAQLRAEGGKIDGAGGHATFKREGTTWKLDRFEDDYIRSNLTTSIKVAAAAGGTGALSDPALGACMLHNAQTMPAAKARAFLFAALNPNRAQAVKLGNRQIEQCPDELAGYVATRLANGLFRDRGASPAFVRCAKRELRGLLSLTDLASTALRGNTSDAGTAALAGLAQGVEDTCGKER
jgi:hypothetical protein